MSSNVECLFLGFEYKNSETCVVCIRCAKEGGAIDLMRIEMPISAIYDVRASIENFICLKEAELLTEGS